MLALLLALAAALGWGTSDFLGGLKSRSNGVLSVMVVSQVTAFVLLGAVAVVRWTPPPGGPALGFASLAGVAELVALGALYRGLSAGDMSIVAPVAAAGPVVPVLADLARGASPRPVQLLGIGVALLGLVILSVEARGTEAAGSRAVAPSIGYGLAAAVGFGMFFVAMDQASESDVGWALLTARSTAVAIIVLTCAVVRHRVRVARHDLPAVVAVGALIVLADASYATATTSGLVSIVAILGSLHTIVTVALAAVVLRERIGRTRWVGIGTALTGAVTIAVG